MKLKTNKIFVLGANGLFGSTIFRYLNLNNNNVWGGISSKKDIKYFKNNKIIILPKIKNKITLLDFSKKFENILKLYKFNYVINCIGYTIHQKEVSYSSKKIINTEFPHLLAKLSNYYNFKIIHLSTDCVFNGKKGNYREMDTPNSSAEYGSTKEKGEIKNNSNAITLRTSGIGHELYKNNNLLEWFLSQKNKSVPGYSDMYFSGPTTLEVAKIIQKIINSKIFNFGLFHISAPKISKKDLLIKINNTYKRNIKIIPKKTKGLDRSLNSSKFKKMYKYKLKNWNILLKELKRFNEKFLQK